MLGVDNSFRKKFDREDYLQRARAREEKKSTKSPVQRKPLKHRDYEVDLESRLGKTQLVNPISQQAAGYKCSVCKCVVKDSATYLDHINGKKHQRRLGMSMRSQRPTLEQVQHRFQLLKNKRKLDFTEQDFDQRILKQLQQEEETKRLRRQKKKQKKAAEEEPQMDPHVAAIMGFGGFSSSKN